jgi:superkiller protein 3
MTEFYQTHKNYSSAIQAFQIALRADPTDQLSWLRLGEAYSKAGKHIAAVKALERAHELQPDDWVCLYFIGDVQRQLGQFREAIGSFESILTDRPLEIGVLMSLGQTYLDLGRSETSTAFTARAEQSFVTSIQVALRAIEVSPGCRGVAWKTATDAIFYLSNRSSFTDGERVRIVLSEVASLVAVRSSDRLSSIISSSHLPEDSLPTGLQALEIAMAAYDYRVTLGFSDTMASGSAWFDLGIALHSWATKVSPSESQRKAEKQAGDCLIQALREDPGNVSYWNALGNVVFGTQPRTAQHAYIKALEIDSKVGSTVMDCASLR